ncbi:MAG: glucose-1-phosphate cytidylyltransferase [Helicobacteraceae bacterium]|jgi:glucose-1-phosphate cytidylyltransferase|nr:glucose-1-phosphate cytidylyltransferase [Helicobacteraceae bacterium]
MKVVILAGGFGTRLSEETDILPKPMVEIGGRPILWHIMKIYSHWGFNEFIVLTGYKSHIIKEFFIDYYARYSDITVDLNANTVEIHKHRTEPWRVTMLYTGQETMTGSRLAAAKDTIGSERFMLTYGDGVSDISIRDLLAAHERSGKTATLTAVQPSGRYGAIIIDENNAVKRFDEKPDGDNAWINGGFFVMEPQIFDYIPSGGQTILEREPLEGLAKAGKLGAYRHYGFWKSMDTLRDKNELTQIWANGKAPWALWERQ